MLEMVSIEAYLTIPFSNMFLGNILSGLSFEFIIYDHDACPIYQRVLQVMEHNLEGHEKCVL